ncbi:MAG: glycosyltransferase [Ruminococcus sp.]|nr:glycosyltransferase [Ruminococcus sp.]
MREAIDSALAQTYKNIEIIVVNDGSCDNGATDAIAREYGDKVRYFCKENGGVSTALNMGIRNMNGEYFSWLSHDDVYTPDKVEKAVEALSKIEDKRAIVCCECVHIDKNSNLISSATNTTTIEKDELVLWDAVLLKMLREGTMNGCALLIHKAVFDDAGMFDETLRFNQDSFMWNKIFLKGYSMLSIPHICVKGRIHDKQLTQTGQAIFRDDCKKMSEFLIPELLKVSTKEKNFIYEYIKYNAKYKNTEVVKTAYIKAKEKKLISFSAFVNIAILRIYGVIRPLIRKMYYSMFRNIKTS